MHRGASLSSASGTRTSHIHSDQDPQKSHHRLQQSVGKRRGFFFSKRDENATSKDHLWEAGGVEEKIAFF